MEIAGMIAYFSAKRHKKRAFGKLPKGPLDLRRYFFQFELAKEGQLLLKIAGTTFLHCNTFSAQLEDWLPYTSRPHPVLPDTWGIIILQRK
ncbi:MAG: hypothetical protein U0N22_06770 [Acutalibacter sp.]